MYLLPMPQARESIAESQQAAHRTAIPTQNITGQRVDEIVRVYMDAIYPVRTALQENKTNVVESNKETATGT